MKDDVCVEVQCLKSTPIDMETGIAVQFYLIRTVLPSGEDAISLVFRQMIREDWSFGNFIFAIDGDGLNLMEKYSQGEAAMGIMKGGTFSLVACEGQPVPY
jgi:hypothetical protein